MSASVSTAWGVLLRAVNVGGHNRVPMAELRQLLADLGCTDVATYLQSGNAVVCADASLASDLPTKIRDGLRERLDVDVPVLIRDGATLRRVAMKHPLGRPGDTHTRLYLGYLSGDASVHADQLDPDRSPGDEFQLWGEHIYVRYGAGAGRSKLTLDYLERRLDVACTMRNWRTVQALAELAAERDDSELYAPK